MSKHVICHILDSGIVSAQQELNIFRTQLVGYQKEERCITKYELETISCIAFLSFVE